MSQNILLISLPGLGDTLMFTPILRPLKQKYPDSRITALVMYGSSRQVLESNPYIDSLVYWEFMKEGFLKSLRFMRRLRARRFDVSILNYPSNRLEYNLVSWLAGARIRIGHRYRRQNAFHLPWLNHHTIRESDALSNVEENIRLLEFLDIDTGPITRDLQIYLSAGDLRYADDFWQAHGLTDQRLVVGMHTWSTELKNMHRKCWSPEKFARLIDHLKEREGTEVLLFEGPFDGPNNDAVAGRARYTPVRVRGTTVKQTAALLRKCRVLVTNDSGVMHLAEAVKTPCAAIFGPTDPGKTGPHHTRHRVIRSGEPCSPCFIYSTRPLVCLTHRDYACLKGVAVEAVAEAVDELMQEPAA